MSDLSKTDVNHSLSVGDRFVIDSPAYKEDAGCEYIVLDVRPSNFGNVIIYDNGEVLESICAYVF